MTSISLDRLAQALGVNETRNSDSHSFATISSVNPDGTYQVVFNGAVTSARAVRCCDASTGDRVLCLISNGQVSAIGKVGGGGTAPAVLYDNPSGSTGNITLEDSAENYDYMRIYYRKTNDVNQCASVDVYEPSGKYASLFIANPRSNYTDMWTAGRLVLISGTSITNLSGGYAEAQIGSGTSGNGDNRVAITRVEAWSGGASIGFGGGSGGGGGGGVPVVDVLYNNDTGGSGTITLSKSVAQYDHIRIYFGYETYARSSVDVYNPNGKQVNLFMQQSYDGQYQTIQSANVVPNGNTITMGSPAKFEVNFNDGALFNFAQANNLRIYRVEAWNGTYTSVTEATCTLDTTYASTGRSTVKVSKNGGVCTITFIPLVLKAQSGRHTFGTVPEGFRPVNNEYYIHPNGWAPENYLIVGTDGTLKAEVNLGGENESYASGTYVIGG